MQLHVSLQYYVKKHVCFQERVQKAEAIVGVCCLYARRLSEQATVCEKQKRQEDLLMLCWAWEKTTGRVM